MFKSMFYLTATLLFGLMHTSSHPSSTVLRSFNSLVEQENNAVSTAVQLAKRSDTLGGWEGRERKSSDICEIRKRLNLLV